MVSHTQLLTQETRTYIPCETKYHIHLAKFNQSAISCSAHDREALWQEGLARHTDPKGYLMRLDGEGRVREQQYLTA